MPSAQPGFDDLARELDLWAAGGRVATFWWRDDDAVEPTPALDRLLALGDRFEIGTALAVIPALASDGLAAAFSVHPRALPVQHGYAHKNHARAGAPAVECGGERAVEIVLTELTIGFRRMVQLFGARFPPILAAPWNRIERPVLERLGEAGFRAASAAGPRVGMLGDHRLAIANAHVDPINWKDRRFAGEAKALSGVLGELRARRSGATDPLEPVGLLTHHLDHDADTWGFLESLFARTTAHAATRWLTIDEAFAADSQGPAA